MTLLFDHRAEGTPEQAWVLSKRLSGCRVVDVPSGVTRLVVVAAHPDDETLGAGGLIAMASRSGLPVEVIIATDGEASHPNSQTHSPAVLAKIRRVEAEAARIALAPIATVTFLGLPDGGLEARRAEIVDVLKLSLDASTLLVTPWSGDRHPDHEACAVAAGVAAAQRGCPHWQYPIWAWHWADPASADLPWGELRRVDLDPESAEAKREAVAAYVSQHEALSDLPGDEAILSPRVTSHFTREFETFIVPSAPASNPEYFEALYARSDDPWGLRDRYYEQRKRDLVCAVLPRDRFRRAFEPGCATGLLTARLARRCDDVLACDVVDRAVALARQRLAAWPNVRVELRRIPENWPAGPFDLLVLSEVGYYCPDLAVLSGRIRAGLAGDGVVVACHWRHHAPDHPHSADEVHRALGAGLRKIVGHVEEDFLLDVWTRSGESVARRGGIVT
ncbi:MAG: bifunctional PIG-L family deacetylase/class I SAM-dependent methyltransferase [Pseudonocardiales bacterium]